MRNSLSPFVVVLIALIAVLAAAFVACGGGGDPAFKPGPLACDGLGKKSYHYTMSVAQEVEEPPPVVLPPATPAPPAAPVTLTWEIQGAVEGGDRVGSIDGKQHNTIPGAVGDVESILLEDGGSYYNLGSGWQQPADPSQSVPLAFQPLNVCNALAPDADTTKLGEGVLETVNGVASRKFSFQDLATQFVTREPDWGGGSDAATYVKTLSGSVWVAEKGNLITKLDVSGAGQYEDGRAINVSVKFELSDLGGDIKVRAPI